MSVRRDETSRQRFGLSRKGILCRLLICVAAYFPTPARTPRVDRPTYSDIECSPFLFHKGSSPLGVHIEMAYSVFVNLQGKWGTWHRRSSLGVKGVFVKVDGPAGWGAKAPPRSVLAFRAALCGLGWVCSRLVPIAILILRRAEDLRRGGSLVCNGKRIIGNISYLAIQAGSQTSHRVPVIVGQGILPTGFTVLSSW